MPGWQSLRRTWTKYPSRSCATSLKSGSRHATQTLSLTQTMSWTQPSRLARRRWSSGLKWWTAISSKASCLVAGSNSCLSSLSKWKKTLLRTQKTLRSSSATKNLTTLCPRAKLVFSRPALLLERCWFKVKRHKRYLKTCLAVRAVGEVLSLPQVSHPSKKTFSNKL